MLYREIEVCLHLAQFLQIILTARRVLEKNIYNCSPILFWSLLFLSIFAQSRGWVAAVCFFNSHANFEMDFMNFEFQTIFWDNLKK